MDADRSQIVLESFLALLLISVLTLLVVSPRFLRLRRSRPFTLLLAGGWIGVGAGLALRQIGVVRPETLYDITPLITIALGWIGLMIGLQARRDVLMQLPRRLYALVGTDVAATLLLIGPLGFLGVRFWMGDATFTAPELWSFSAALLLASCAIGWSMETRSLRVDGAAGERAQQRAMFIRAGGALGALVAVGVYGVGSKFFDGGAPERAAAFSASLGLIRLALTVVFAVLAGLLGRYALQLAGRNRSELLAVFLGLVALITGGAATLGFSPLFAAALTGVVIANLSGRELRQFERFILQAEHVVAVLFGVLAGVMIDVAVGALGVALALLLAGARIALKPAVVRVGAGAALERDASAGAKLLAIAPARQGPIAIALAVSFALNDRTSAGEQLLAIVVMVGVLSELAPLLRSSGRVRGPLATTTASLPQPSPGSSTESAP